jgi:hypothetical protein
MHSYSFVLGVALPELGRGGFEGCLRLRNDRRPPVAAGTDMRDMKAPMHATLTLVLFLSLAITTEATQRNVSNLPNRTLAINNLRTFSQPLWVDGRQQPATGLQENGGCLVQQHQRWEVYLEQQLLSAEPRSNWLPPGLQVAGLLPPS